LTISLPGQVTDCNRSMDTADAILKRFDPLALPNRFREGWQR
jgi:hypothetical protein